MVEVAIEMGYLSEGVEPSLWLSNIAQERGLPVYTGVLPSDLIQGKFDAITLFDVIEHVTDPIELIRNASSYLKSEGILFIVTPDVNSITAKLLKSKWWHFRIAHVGYFSNRSLNLLMEKCGFSRVKGYRPNWYFPTYYIFKRLTKYFPILARISLPKVITDTTLRVNFFDSIAVIYKLNDKKIKHTELY
jgi:SAM-dependent methyltransferase